MTPTFEPTRTAGLQALATFLPRAGKTYASERNHDRGPEGHPNVSCLSPYIRHRLVTEEEVLEAVLGRFAPSTAEKFIQEVCWRTYWKGWLEMRPSVWTSYRAGVRRGLDRVAAEGGLRQGWEQACTGQTGIAPFDHWAQELVETGYLHNHARMWFASIWCFTLRLPWELGADFFLRHLLDGDPAANTLGWRWVAGLQTPGKVYAARASNITKYTGGRFGAVNGLAQNPAPLDGTPNPPPGPAPVGEGWDRSVPTALLLTEDDLSPGWLLRDGVTPVGTAVLLSQSGRSPLAVSTAVAKFTQSAAQDSLARHGAKLGANGPITDDPDMILDWVAALKVSQLVLPHPPVGPSADRIAKLVPRLGDAGIAVSRPLRPWDSEAWPHATHGFFRFKLHIPRLIAPYARQKGAA